MHKSRLRCTKELAKRMIKDNKQTNQPFVATVAHRLGERHLLLELQHVASVHLEEMNRGRSKWKVSRGKNDGGVQETESVKRQRRR